MNPQQDETNSVTDYGMSEQGLRDRLIHNEEAVQNLSERFLTHERFVHTQFSAFDAKLDSLEQSTRESEGKILDKLSSIQVSNSNRHNVSWPLVLSICSVLIVIAGGFANESKARAVNTVSGEIHRHYQDVDNSNAREWSRRLSDRILENKDSLAHYYEHREGLELENLMDRQIERLAHLESNMTGVITKIEALEKLVDRNLKFGDQSIEERSAANSAISDLQNEVNTLRDFMSQAQKELGQLEPLTDEMGMQALQGAVERLELLESLVKSIDEKGSRVWNDNSPK